MNMIRKIVGFKLAKEIEKYFFIVSSRAWDNAKFLSSHNPNLRPLDPALRCSTTELQTLWRARSLRSSYMTRVLHNAEISKVDSAMYLPSLELFVDVREAEIYQRPFTSELKLDTNSHGHLNYTAYRRPHQADVP